VNEISWITATENDNDHFELQRSEDGTKWDIMEVIAGAGTSEEAHSYERTDAHPFPLTFYRLAQVDGDGSKRFSSVIAVRNDDGPADLVVAPNPARDHLTVFALPGFTANSIAVLSLDGRILREQAIDPSRMSTAFELQVGDLPAGTYAVLLRSEGATLRAAWVKQR
jgi:hypothetical protein